MLLTLVPLGLGSGPAFLHAYRKTKERRWLRAGVAYLTISVAGVAAIALIGEVDEESVWRDVAAVTSVGMWLLSIGHALVARKKVIGAIEGLEGEESSRDDAAPDEKVPWAQRPLARRVVFPVIGVACVLGGAVFAVRAQQSGSELIRYMRASSCPPGRVTGCIAYVDAEIVRIYSEFVSRSADDHFVVLSLPSGSRTAEMAFSADYERVLEGYVAANVKMWEGDPIEISSDTGYLPTTFHPAFATYSNAANGFIGVAFGLMFLIASVILEMKSSKPLYSISLLRPRLIRRHDPGLGIVAYDLVPRMIVRLMMPLMLIASGVVVARYGFKAGPQVTLMSVGICGVLSLPILLQGRVSLRFRPNALEYRGGGLVAELTSWEVGTHELQGTPRGVLLVANGKVQVRWWAKPYWALSSVLGENPQQVLPLDLTLVSPDETRDLVHFLESGAIHSVPRSEAHGSEND